MDVLIILFCIIVVLGAAKSVLGGFGSSSEEFGEQKHVKNQEP